MPETFRQLVARHADSEEREDSATEETSLAAIQAGKADPMGLVGYFASIGLPVGRLDDLLRINDLPDEEEVSAHPVAEGIALAIASHGAWVLFRP